MVGKRHLFFAIYDNSPHQNFMHQCTLELALGVTTELIDTISLFRFNRSVDPSDIRKWIEAQTKTYRANIRNDDLFNIIIDYIEHNRVI